MSVAQLPQLLTLDELAFLARESKRTIERRVAAGEIEVVHLGPRTVRVTSTEAERYLQARPPSKVERSTPLKEVPRDH